MIPIVKMEKKLSFSADLEKKNAFSLKKAKIRCF